MSAADGGRPGAEARRVGDAMRLVIERLVGTKAPPDDLARAADQLETIAASLAPYPQGRIHEGFSESANAGDIRAFFEWSPLIGRANPLAPPISVEMEGDVVVGTACFGSAYEGPPGCVHGGFIAASFDEILGVANSYSGQPAMTGTLTIRYRKPTPLYQDLVFKAWLVGVDGRKISTRGELYAGDTLTAEAEGLFISVGAGKFQQLMATRNATSGPGADQRRADTATS